MTAEAAGALAEEAGQVLGVVDELHIEELAHNQANQITAGIWRVSTATDRPGTAAAVLKVLTPPGSGAGADWWTGSDEPQAWNWWRREAEVHRGGWPERWYGAEPVVGGPDGDVGGAVGAPSNLVSDSVFDGFLPAAALAELDRLVWDGYRQGLAASGWSGDPRLARLAMCASAVKYHWLAPHLLAKLHDEVHLAYGGRDQVDATHQYRERFAALAHLVGWADEARALAGELGA